VGEPLKRSVRSLRSFITMNSISKISWWRAGLLGAVDAAVYACVLFLIEKVVRYEGWPRVSWAWVSITILLVFCFVPISVLIHRAWASRMRSVFLLWVGIGVVAVSIWNGVFLLAARWEMYAHNYDVLYYEINNPRNPQYGLFSFALVVATNLAFAGLVKMSRIIGGWRLSRN